MQRRNAKNLATEGRDKSTLRQLSSKANVVGRNREDPRARLPRGLEVEPVRRRGLRIRRGSAGAVYLQVSRAIRVGGRAVAARRGLESSLTAPMSGQPRLCNDHAPASRGRQPTRVSKTLASQYRGQRHRRAEDRRHGRDQTRVVTMV